MKLRLKVIGAQQDKAFQIMKVNEPYFFPSWHFHPEYEIMLVQKGTGIRFVGDSMERFQDGDLVFYGTNIPHLYRSDEEYYLKGSNAMSKAIVVYFKESFLGESFLDLPDIAPIKKLFSQSRRGMKFRGKAKQELINEILKLNDEKDGMGRIIDLLTILRTMANTKEYDLLSSSAFIKYSDEDDCERMNKVYQFIMDNYSKNPSLEAVSAIANLSTTAFCRYFKSRTNKTYTQFLNEIKIGNACKLLIDNDLSISQVCFEIGFNNCTHFNTQFKRILGITPTQYQVKHFYS
jgi:AraC-like DNA-binding protein/quercetin dioxygenase-like cupin family protein